MHLVYRSNAMPITIDNYVGNSFTYDKWVISDEYTEVAIGHEYRIVVSSFDEIKDPSDLTIWAFQTSAFVAKLTMLLKYAICFPLNSPHNQITYRCCRFVDVREMPKGWTSNFDKVDSFLMETCTSYGSLTLFPNNEYMPTSALDEIRIALNNYDNLEEEIKDLIAVHNSAVEADERSCFLILGKVIDMINYLYPLDSHRKPDKRINDYFPELLPFFDNTTIKDLMSIANNRKETRHYNKNRNQSHPSLCGKEAELYYQRIDVLATDIVRKRLGLLPIEVNLSNQKCSNNS